MLLSCSSNGLVKIKTMQLERWNPLLHVTTMEGSACLETVSLKNVSVHISSPFSYKPLPSCCSVGNPDERSALNVDGGRIQRVHLVSTGKLCMQHMVLQKKKNAQPAT